MFAVPRCTADKTIATLRATVGGAPILREAGYSPEHLRSPPNLRTALRLKSAQPGLSGQTRCLETRTNRCPCWLAVHRSPFPPSFFHFFCSTVHCLAEVRIIVRLRGVRWPKRAAGQLPNGGKRRHVWVVFHVPRVHAFHVARRLAIDEHGPQRHHAVGGV